MIFLTASIATSDLENCTRIPVCHYQRKYHSQHLAGRFVDELAEQGDIFFFFGRLYASRGGK